MIKCPCCFCDLVITHQDRYETLAEHVDETEPSLKDGYQCPNSSCKAHEMNAVWIEEGDFWIKEPPAGMDLYKAREEVENHSMTERIYAVNSWQDGYERYRKDQEKRKITLNLFFFIFELAPRYKKIENACEWKRTGEWKRTIMRRATEGRYIHFMTFWDIFFFELEVYKTNYSKAIAKDQNALEILQASINNENLWGTKDDRFWWKLARFTISWIIYPGKSRIIKNIQI